MAVNMNTVNAYTAYQNSYNSALSKDKKAETAQKTKSTDLPVTNGQKTLSKAAQQLLEKLRTTYTDKDFMVADFDKGDDAQEILSRGTKEFSVLFSSEELEKMAADENYYNEKMASIDDAVRMSEEINAKYGFASAFGQEGSEQGVVTRFGISFNSDGTTSFFAELEKVSEKQRERIESAREKNAEEKTENAEKAQEQKENLSTKKVMLQASSIEELIRQMNAIDWSKIKETTQVEGGKFDYSV